MSNSREIVEKIRGILADPTGASQSQLEGIAEEFASRCRRLDELLTRFISSLNMGSYAEADRISCEESLVDEYNALNFPQWQEWREICQSLGLRLPPAINNENGARLLRFASEYGSRRDLFSLLRRQALEDAPYDERLDVLYQLEAVFTGNPIWERSIQRLEETRSNEIEKFLKEFQFQNVGRFESNIRLLTGLLEELTSPVRHTAASPELCQKLRKGIAYLSSENTFQQMLVLLGDWQNAALVDQESSFPQYLERWNELLASLDSDAVVPAEMQGVADKLIALTQDYQRRRNLLDGFNRRELKLSTLLSQNAPEADLIAAYSDLEVAAEAVGTNVPTGIAETYRNRVANLRLQRSRRIVASLVVIIFIGALLIAGVWTASRRSARQKLVAEATQEVSSKLDAFEKDDYFALAEARRVLEAYEKRTSNLEVEPDFIKQKERLERLERDDQTRIAQFKEHVDKLEKAHAQETSVPSSVNFLKDAAKTEEEKAIYLRLKKEDLTWQIAAQKRVDEKYSEKLNKSIDAEKELEANINELDFDSQKKEISRLRGEIATLTSSARVVKVSDVLQKTTESLVVALDGLERRVLTAEAIRKGTEALQNALDDADSYQAVLEELDGQLEESDLKTSVRLAKESASFLDDVSAWNAFVEQYASLATNQEAKSDLYEAYATELKNSAERFSFAPKFDVLQRQADAFQTYAHQGGFQQTSQDLLKLFKRYSKPLWLFHFEDGDYYYYLTSKVDSSTKSARNKISDTSDEDFNLDLIDKSERDSLKPAAQYELYQLISESFKGSVSEKEEFDAIEKVLTRCFDAEVKIDPYLRVVLIREILGIVVHSPDFSAFQEILDEIDGDSEFDPSTNFYQPSRELRKQRELATTIWSKLSKNDRFEVVMKRAQDAFKSRQEALSQRFKLIGFIDVQGNAVQLNANLDNLQDGSLWILQKENGASRATECGVVLNGQAQIRPNFASFRWSPVFLLVK